jgi:hypothetical protein
MLAPNSTWACTASRITSAPMPISTIRIRARLMAAPPLYICVIYQQPQEISTASASPANSVACRS